MKLIDLFEEPRVHPVDVRPETRGPRTEKQMGKELYIKNPDIIDIEVGNMVRAWEDEPRYYEDADVYMTKWGMIVRSVDYKKQMVLVSSHIDEGPRARTEWVPIVDISVTWNTGGTEAVRSGLKKFGKVFDKWKNQQNDDEYGELPGERKPKERMQ